VVWRGWVQLELAPQDQLLFRGQSSDPPFALLVRWWRWDVVVLAVRPLRLPFVWWPRVILTAGCARWGSALAVRPFRVRWRGA
jgi:hypothetical protein